MAVQRKVSGPIREHNLIADSKTVSQVRVGAVPAACIVTVVESSACISSGMVASSFNRRLVDMICVMSDEIECKTACYHLSVVHHAGASPLHPAV